MKLPTLDEIVKKTMAESSFQAQFPAEVIEEVEKMAEPLFNPTIKDLRNIPFFSIDNDTSLDLDQLTYAEKISPDSYKAVIAIADVRNLVAIGSATDDFAGFNTTSVYTPTKVYPMLPTTLSHGLTSLLPSQDRKALIVEVTVNEFGETSLLDIYYAWVANHEKLTYEKVAAFLEDGTELPIDSKISEQLLLQDTIAQQIKQFRISKGALELTSRDAIPIIEQDQVVAAISEKPNRARELIENFMIAANLSCNHFLKETGYPRICRVVKIPKNWPRIVEIAKEKHFELPSEPNSLALNQFLKKMRQSEPEAFPDLSLTVIKLLGRGEYTAVLNDEDAVDHFGLSLKDYTHATAPNRRFADLAMGRLIHAALKEQTSPYTLSELDAIAKNCSIKEVEAEKIERKLNKCAIARLFIDRTGEKFRAIVTGASEKGIWVRVLAIPIEGKLVKNKSKVQVGDKISVMLVHVDPLEGFIDFVEI